MTPGRQAWCRHGRAARWKCGVKTEALFCAPSGTPLIFPVPQQGSLFPGRGLDVLFAQGAGWQAYARQCCWREARPLLLGGSRESGICGGMRAGASGCQGAAVARLLLEGPVLHVRPVVRPGSGRGTGAVRSRLYRRVGAGLGTGCMCGVSPAGLRSWIRTAISSGRMRQRLPVSPSGSWAGGEVPWCRGGRGKRYLGYGLPDGVAMAMMRGCLPVLMDES